MTRPNLIVGALAAVCVGMLLWCARLILAADLPLGAHVASWVLWAVATVAVVTLMAYLREFLTHRQVVGREASWKPLPSLVLLWIGGLTALLSFAFILPDKASSDGAGSAKANTSLTGQTVPSAPATTTAATGAARQTTSTTSSRSVASRTVPPAPVSTTVRRSTPTGGATTARTSAATTPSTTTSPLIDIHILPPPANPTTPPGRG